MYCCVAIGSKVSKQPNEYIKKTNTSVDNQKFNKNNNVTETRLYIEKKKKETSEKHKLEMLDKKRLAEERKIRLDNLRKTTRELAKASVKQKVIEIILLVIIAIVVDNIFLNYNL